MLILKSRQDVNDFVQSVKSKKLTIGFVPTMGALHQGHLTLIKKSIEENQYTICSIFVNPTQFNNLEDLENYPRTEKEDLDILNSVGCDAVYLPKTEDIYPQGPESEPINLNGLDSVMEGLFRPGHFQGVATVVKRLFLQVQPTNAYFGEKDFQQLQIIRQMVKEEKLPVKVIGVPTVREENGLALSSRNMRLSDDYKQKATFIYQTLLEAKKLSFSLPPNQIIKKIENLYEQTDLKLEYFTIAEEDSLKVPEKFEEGKKYRGFVAAYAQNVRLIDNLQIR